MIRSDDFAALIPAAGRSSRMGKFKPLLPLNGRPMIERIIDTIRAASIERILVVTGHRSRDLIPVLDRKCVRWAMNPDYRQDMFSSITCGIAHLPGPLAGFFLIPSDMPFIQPGVFRTLLAVFDPEDMDMVRPCYEGRRGHPVLISASKTDEMAAYSGRGGLRTLVKKQRWRTVDRNCDDPGILIDLDHPQEYERFVAGEGGNGRPRVMEPGGS